MRLRMMILTATVALVVAATTGTAFAVLPYEAQQLCIGKPGTAVTTPTSGVCEKGHALVTVPTLAQLNELEFEVSQLQKKVPTLESKVSTLESDNTTLKSKVSVLEGKLSKVSYEPEGLNGKPTLKIAGANLQVVNGTGKTESANGLGNLIIGYDATREGMEQTGSHNLVVGDLQTFTSWSGVMGGVRNRLSGRFDFAVGIGNTASGDGSSVSGGEENTSSDLASSVSGGQVNRAIAPLSSVSGGAANEAVSLDASISGGVANKAGTFASVSGGEKNVAAGNTSSVTGGLGNQAFGNFTSLLGGNGITLYEEYSTYPAGP